MSIEQRSHTTADGILGYLFAEPTANRHSSAVTSVVPTPLVVFLHGKKDSGKDLSKLLTWGLPKAVQSHADLPYYFVAPQIDEDANWADSGERVLALIDDLVASLPIDTQQIVLVGFSAGTVGAWSIAAAHPKRFARLALLSGRLPASVHGEQLTALKHVPVWLFQGGRDDKLPQAEAEKTIAALRAQGFSVEYTLLPEGDHFIADAVFADQAVHQWLAEADAPQRKAAA